MLNFTLKRDGAIEVTGDSYSLHFAQDRPYVTLKDAQGLRLADLFALSSVHTQSGLDDTPTYGMWEVLEREGEVLVSMAASSSLWRQKSYLFHCFLGRFVYQVEVEGDGRLREVDFFGGYASAQTRWGTGFFYSGQQFQHGFIPEPNSDEKNWFSAAENASINLGGVPLPGRSDWFFTPPPFCYAFAGENGWVGMGIEAPPGAYRFSEYGYHGRLHAFHLSLSYDDRTSVASRGRLPAVAFDFGQTEFDVLSAHVRSLRQTGSAPERYVQERPAWWHEPIFCGWGAQSCLADAGHGKAQAYARQDHYDDFLTHLESKQINPGILVIDDKWQLTYGENQVDPQKWPDLPGFICQQHEKGRKVLLWLKAWDPEGVPPGECITNTAGVSVAVDPTSPRYEERLRASVRRMLGAGGYGADGFKIDFTARIPNGPGLKLHGDAWGLELMKKYLGILYSEAKAVRPDALVITHTPHPYLADMLDMVRLNDINTSQEVNPAMELRARIARLACPEALIDTDNWPMPNKAAWRKYLEIQPELGVPSLYFTTEIGSSKEALEESDYQLIRDAWALYRKKTAARLAARQAGPGWEMIWRLVYPAGSESMEVGTADGISDSVFGL